MPVSEYVSTGRFGAYVRISKEGYRSEAEVEAQLARYIAACRQAAEARGITLDESAVVTETDVSGTLAVDDRALGALIAQVEAGTLAGIIAPDVDRFARDVEHGCSAWRRVVQESGGRLIFATDYIDSADGEPAIQKERFQYRLVNGEGFAVRQGGKLGDIAKQSVESGIHSGSIPPLGYKWPGTSVLLPNGKTRFKKSGPLELTGEETKVLAAFEAMDTGVSWSNVIAILGCKSQGAAKSILRNRVYLGEARTGKTVKEGAHPRVVSDELFERVQRKLDRRARDRNAKLAEHPTETGTTKTPKVLAGVMRCGCCAHSMTPSMEHGKESYRCKYQGAGWQESHPDGKPYISAADVLPVVLELAKGWHRVHSPIFMLGREADAAMRPALEAALTEAEAEVEAVEAMIGTTLPADSIQRAAVRGARAALEEHEAADGWFGMPPEAVEERLASGDVETINSFLRETIRPFVFLSPYGKRFRCPPEERIRFQYLSPGSIDPATPFEKVELPVPGPALPVEKAPPDQFPEAGVMDADEAARRLAGLTEPHPVEVSGGDGMSGILVPIHPAPPRPGRCALCGMPPHGGGYCGHGPYSSADPFCFKCYETGDDCTHSPEERAKFDREAVT
jgi:Resolvase, N terminal domain/Recombinase